MGVIEQAIPHEEQLSGKDYLAMRLKPLSDRIAAIESGYDTSFKFLLNLKPAIEKMLSDEPMPDYSDFPERPMFIDVATAHREGMVTYNEYGVATFRHPELSRLPQFKDKRPSRRKVRIGLDNQFPDILGATFASLNKSLSTIDNSPRTEDGRTLRQMFESEMEIFERKKNEATAKDGWEPAEYGTYVYMPKTKTLHIIAPEKLHRISLLTSTSILYKNPGQNLKWYEGRKILEPKVIGHVGMSVGGPIANGLDQDARMAESKYADFDRLESGNFNRVMGPRLLYDYVGSRAERVGEDAFNLRRLKNSKNEAEREKYDLYVKLLKDSDNIPWKLKAKQVAMHILSTHPQKKAHIYEDPIDIDNVLQFLLGDGGNEKPVDMVIEEVDRGRIKVEMRVLCKILGIPLMMISDFGQKTVFQFYDWPKRNDGIGYKKNY